VRERTLSGTQRPPPLGAFGARVGIYGGSFDPVHLGHVHVARQAQARWGLTQVVFVPAAQSPHKLGQRLAPAADRVRMLEIALAHEPSWSVWTAELERAGPSYTVDTLSAARGELRLPPGCELYLLLGSDNLRGFERWRDVERILELAQPIVVQRDGADADEAFEQLRRALSPAGYERLARGRLRAPVCPAASTSVREQLARGEAPLEQLPPGVLEYARASGIYAAPPSGDGATQPC
jgi:nicotinate-nucleotide adenylyltransferase